MYARRQPTFFVEKLVQWSSLFGVAPWYSVQQHRLAYTNMFKWYSAILASFVLCTSMFVLYSKCKMFHSWSTIPTVLPIMTHLTAFCKYAIVILGAGFWNMHTWEKFLKQVRHIKKNIGSTSQHILARNEKTSFILSNIFIVVMYIFDISTFNENIGKSVYFIFSYVSGYIAFVLVTLILNFTTSIILGYRHLNGLLTSVSFDDNYGSSMKTFRKIRKMFLVLEDTVDNFNKLMGWCLLLTLFEEVQNTLGCLLFVTVHNFGNHALEEKRTAINVCYIAATTVSQWFLQLAHKSCFQESIFYNIWITYADLDKNKGNKTIVFW